MHIKQHTVQKLNRKTETTVNSGKSKPNQTKNRSFLLQNWTKNRTLSLSTNRTVLEIITICQCTSVVNHFITYTHWCLCLKYINMACFILQFLTCNKISSIVNLVLITCTVFKFKLHKVKTSIYLFIINNDRKTHRINKNNQQALSNRQIWQMCQNDPWIKKTKQRLN